MIKISVVIAAYNAEKFIRKAVESAVHFQEVNEVVLVEDGSTDNTLNVCKQLKEEYDKIKLYLHPNNINKGAGASWNLGIKNATCEYITFLGADDYYLSNRFDAEKGIFYHNADADGVYGALGVHYYSNDGKDKFKKRFSRELTTVNKVIPPAELKYILLDMSKTYMGYFSLNSLTVKKSLVEKIGYFNEKLRLHQDSVLIVKLAFLGTLVPGSIKVPVAIRGVHDGNRITSSDHDYNSEFLQYFELEKWMDLNIIGEEKAKRCIRKERLVYQLLKKDGNKLFKISELIRLFINEPYLFYVDRDFNRLIKSVFGNILPVKVSVRLKKMMFHVILRKRINKWNDYLYH